MDERNAAQTKLIAIGTPAKVALQVALDSQESSAEVQDRTSFASRVIKLHEKFSPQFREKFPNAATELIRNAQHSHVWVKYFLMVGNEKKFEYSVTDLLTLGVGVLRNLKSTDMEMKVACFEIIEQRELYLLIPEMIARLKDVKEDWQVRCYAARLLDTFKAKEAIPTMIACFKNDEDNVYVRINSALKLGNLDAKEAIPELLACFKNDKEPRILRACVAASLGELGAKEAIPALRACLKIEKSKAPEVIDDMNEGSDKREDISLNVRIALNLLGEKLEPEPELKSELKSLPTPVE